MRNSRRTSASRFTRTTRVIDLCGRSAQLLWSSAILSRVRGTNPPSPHRFFPSGALFFRSLVTLCCRLAKRRRYCFLSFIASSLRTKGAPTSHKSKNLSLFPPCAYVRMPDENVEFLLSFLPCFLRVPGRYLYCVQRGFAADHERNKRRKHIHQGCQVKWLQGYNDR